MKPLLPKSTITGLVVIALGLSFHPSVRAEDAAETTPPPSSPPAPAPTPKYNSRTPRYHSIRPNWGAELNGSLDAFSRTIWSGQNNRKIYGVTASFEYQPDFLQDIGVIGIGPSVGIYPTKGGLTSDNLSLLSAGLQARYQARFFHRQILVPVGGFAIEYFHYRFANGPIGNMTLTDPFFGVWLLMNFLEPSAAADSYVNSGITRTYAIVEVHNKTGSDQTISVNGQSLFFGVRVEF